MVTMKTTTTTQDSNGHVSLTESHIGCSIKTVPTRLLEKASKVAIEVNPVNAPVLGHWPKLPY